MARLLTEACDERSLAVQMLLVAAKELPVSQLRRFASMLNEELAVATLADPDADDRLKRAIDCIRRVAALVGHVPSTTEYSDAYRTQSDTDEPRLMGLSTIVTIFGSWPLAVAASGYAPAPTLRGVARRRVLARRRVARYSNERLVQALRACASDISRPPSARDYEAWRENALGARPGRRLLGADIPHFRTIEKRFRGWNNALEAAGFPADPAIRATQTEYSDL